MTNYRYKLHDIYIDSRPFIFANNSRYLPQHQACSWGIYQLT